MPPRSRRSPVPESVPFVGDVSEENPITEKDAAFNLGIEDVLPTEKPEPPKARNTQLKREIERLYANIGTAVFMFDPVCGSAFLTNAEKMAESMEELARKDPRVKRTLEKMLETSTIGMVVAAHAPLLATLVTHHVPTFRERFLSRATEMMDQQETKPEEDSAEWTPPVYQPPTQPEMPPTIYD